MTEQVEADSLVLADTIGPNLRFEVDCPSLHVEGAVPILDLMVWVEGGLLRHRFYQKDCAPERTIMANTKLSWRTKRGTIFQEGMRRIRAWDSLATEGEKIAEMERYAKKTWVELFQRQGCYGLYG